MAVFSDTRGFTLIEFLIAVVILAVGLLALLQSVNIAIGHNMANVLRNEGTQVADDELTKELAKGSTAAGFAAISTTTRHYVVRRTIPTTLNAYKNYSITKTGNAITANTKQVTIQIVWHLKHQRFSQSAASLITSMQQ